MYHNKALYPDPARHQTAEAVTTIEETAQMKVQMGIGTSQMV